MARFRGQFLCNSPLLCLLLVFCLLIIFPIRLIEGEDDGGADGMSESEKEMRRLALASAKMEDVSVRLSSLKIQMQDNEVTASDEPSNHHELQEWIDTILTTAAELYPGQSYLSSRYFSASALSSTSSFLSILNGSAKNKQRQQQETGGEGEGGQEEDREDERADAREKTNNEQVKAENQNENQNENEKQNEKEIEKENEKGKLKEEEEAMFGSLWNHGPFMAPERLTTVQQQPLNKMQFLKTHKTGSSTLQGIIGRRAFFAEGYLRPFIYRQHLLDLKTAALSNRGTQYDVVLQHLVGPVENQATLKRYMERLVPRGQLVSIVRDPVERAISHWYYYQEPGSGSRLAPHERHSESRVLAELRQIKFGENNANQLHVSGLLPLADMVRHIDNVDILILERFDESLVLRHFFWGWKLEELLYLRVNSCGTKRWDGKPVLCPPDSLKHNWPQDLAHSILASTPIDALIYQRAIEVHEAAIAMIDPALFQAALAEFQRMQNTLQTACSAPGVPRASSWAIFQKLFADQRGKGFPAFETLIESPVKYCSMFWMSDVAMEQTLRRLEPGGPSRMERPRPQQRSNAFRNPPSPGDVFPFRPPVPAPPSPVAFAPPPIKPFKPLSRSPLIKH